MRLWDSLLTALRIRKPRLVRIALSGNGVVSALARAALRIEQRIVGTINGGGKLP